MSKKTSFCVKNLGALLFLGLCIFMLGRVTSVSAADSEPRLNVNSVSIIRDGSFRLKVYNLNEGETVVYRTSDASVAAVSSTGNVKGVGYGSATVTAIVMSSDAAKVTLQCDVLIGPAAVSVKFNKTEVVIPEGKTKTLKVQVTPLNTVESPVFYSTNTDIASVSAVGRVRAKSTGIVQVYAFLSNKQVSVCDVVVLSAEDYQRYLDGMSVEDIMEELSDMIGEEGAGSELDGNNAVEVPANSDDKVVTGSTSNSDNTVLQ